LGCEIVLVEGRTGGSGFLVALGMESQKGKGKNGAPGCSDGFATFVVQVCDYGACGWNGEVQPVIGGHSSFGAGALAYTNSGG
jgi:hypothetical protein